MTYRLTSRTLALSLALLSSCQALADNYLQGKVANADTDNPDTYRVSGVYGIALDTDAPSSLELDLSFTTDDLEFNEQAVELNTLELRPESAGLYFSQTYPILRGTFCSDLYFRSGMTYSMDERANYSSLLSIGQWSPSIGVGLMHRQSDSISYLADFTHVGGDNRFNVGFSYEMGLFR